MTGTIDIERALKEAGKAFLGLSGFRVEGLGFRGLLPGAYEVRELGL